MGIRSLSSASISTGAKRSKFWDQSANLTVYGTEWIATATGNPNGSVTLSNIPTVYDYLEIRATVRADSTASDMEMIVNGDTTNNYTFHQMYLANGGSSLDGSSPQGATLSTNWNPANIAPTATEGNIMCTLVMQISNSSGKWKNYQARSAWTNHIGASMSGYYIIRSGSWRSPDKITSLEFRSNSSDFGLSSNTKIDLYGVKI